MTDRNLQNGIRVHGVELVIIAVMIFVALLSGILASYRYFIIGRARVSPEYLAAEHFVNHSIDVREALPSPLDELEFVDIRVLERDSYGIGEFKFNAWLENGERVPVRIGLVKVADFWIVYSAVLGRGKANRKRPESTYDRIITLMQDLTFDSHAGAEARFPVLRDGIRDDVLRDYLEALALSRLDPEQALMLLDGIENRVTHAKLAVLSLESQIHYDRQNFTKAIEILNRMEWVYEHETVEHNEKILTGIFAGLPKSPFLADMDPDNVMASARKLMSLSLSAIGQITESLYWAERAIEQSEKIKSSVLRSSSLYLKALSLYDLERFGDADRIFAEVIADIDNPNLSQKSWAYFFRAEIAARQVRHQDSLDFYELAITLEPTNAMIREGAIRYLMLRGLTGDLEVALGLAIRGIDFGVERLKFLDLASQTYRQLGLKDRTHEFRLDPVSP